MNKRIVILLFLLLCSASWAVFAQSDNAKRQPSYTEKGTEGCMVCHSGEKMRDMLASAHGSVEDPAAPMGMLGCESCHGPGSFHVSRAHGGAGFPDLLKFGRGKDKAPREDQLEACLKCHAQDDMDIEAIHFAGGPHDKKAINCSTCHKLHQAPKPEALQEQYAGMCKRCHKKDIEAHPRFEEKSIDFEALACWTCHDVHQDLAAE